MERVVAVNAIHAYFDPLSGRVDVDVNVPEEDQDTADVLDRYATSVGSDEAPSVSDLMCVERSEEDREKDVLNDVPCSFFSIVDHVVCDASSLLNKRVDVDVTKM